jgi:hypothetical protein
MTVRQRGSDTRSDLRHLGFGLCAFGGRNASMETQEFEQRLATQIAQHHTKREGGNRRAKNHQHVDLIFHNGPLNLVVSSPFVRRMRTCDRKRQCDMHNKASVALTLVSVAE